MPPPPYFLAPLSKLVLIGTLFFIGCPVIDLHDSIFVPQNNLSVSLGGFLPILIKHSFELLHFVFVIVFLFLILVNVLHLDFIL